MKDSPLIEIRSENFNPTWTHHTIDVGKYPISLIRCTIESSIGTSTGYGESFFPKKAIDKSLSEAWERQHLIYIKNNLPDLRDKTGGYSNGFAAGKNINESRLRAKFELIERYVFIQAWKNMSGWYAHFLLSSRAKVISKLLAVNNWHCRFFELRANKYVIIAGLAVHKEYGAVFDSTLNLNIKLAEIKIILSLIKGISIREKSNEVGALISDDPNSHGKFYGDPKNLVAFNFLNNATTNSISYDIDEDDFKYIDFKLSPKMPFVSVAWNEKWPPIQWGDNSISGNNQWPHPQS